MDIIVSSEDRKEIIQLPIIPEEGKDIVSFPHNEETISTIDGGDILLIGNEGLKTITLSSWIPMKQYSFVKSSVLGTQAKEFFVKWKLKRRPIRVVIINKNGYTFHNELYYITQFDFGFDEVGDMTYTLNLKQFVSKKVKK